MFIAHDPCLNIVQFQKVWYPWNQLIEIFQILPVPKKLRKKGGGIRVGGIRAGRVECNVLPNNKRNYIEK